MPIEFLNVRVFWAMVGLVFLVGAMLWGLRRRQAFLREFGRMDLIAQFSRFSSEGKGTHQVLLTAFCFCLLIISWARPTLPGASREIVKGTLDVVAVLDVSKSMRAEDCAPLGSRFEVAKAALLQCLPDLRGNRFGLVTFAGKSFPQAELTDDFDALKFVLKNWVNVDSAPSQGSNIGKALTEAGRLFGEEKRRRVILLISDGGHVRPDNIDGILADISGKGMTVVAAGVGTREGAKIPVYEQGKFQEWFKIEGKEAETRLNDTLLKEIARKTGGKYMHLTSVRELKGILRDPAVVGAEALSGGREIFQIPLGLAIGVAFLGMYLKRRTTSPTAP